MKALTAALALAGVLTCASQAAAAVKPGDTFTFDVAGFNNSSGVGYLLGSAFTTTFGATQTFQNAGYDGQSYTINSYEVVGSSTTTDYFTISTPTNFLNEASVNGTSITALQFDVGDSNSGSNTVDLLFPIGSATATGDIIYGSANTKFNLTPVVTVSNGGYSISSAEGVNYGTNSINTLAIHQFDLAVTYANPAVSAAPEPGSWALMLAGVAAIGAMLRVRKARRTEDAIAGARIA